MNKFQIIGSNKTKIIEGSNIIKAFNKINYEIIDIIGHSTYYCVKCIKNNKISFFSCKKL